MIVLNRRKTLQGIAVCMQAAVAMLLINMQAKAGTDLVLRPRILELSGPSDANISGHVLNSSAVTGSQLKLCDKNNGNGLGLNSAQIVSVNASSNQKVTINGVSYPVFNTSVKGVGWVLGVKDAYANNFTPLGTTVQRWFPAPGTDTAPHDSIGGFAQLWFVKTDDHIATGSIQIPTQRLAKVVCSTVSGNWEFGQDNAYISMQNTLLESTAHSCRVTSGTAVTTTLSPVSSVKLPTVGSVVDAGNATISLACEAGLKVHATLSDQSDTSNRSDLLKLSNGSSAAGLGIRTSVNDKIVTLGPDSSSAGTTNQFIVNTGTTSDNQTVTLPLKFQYVRTGDLVGGQINGLLGVTFSYQ